MSGTTAARAIVAPINEAIGREAKTLALWPWLAVGIVARMAAFSLANFPTVGDAHSYLMLAQSVVSGSGLIVDVAPYGPAQALFPPAYPLLLAAVGSVFGVSNATAAVLNLGLDLAATAMIARYNRVAAAMFFCWPTLILNSTVPQKESLEIVLSLTLVLIVGGIRRHGTPAFGAVSALLVLTQPALLFFPVALWIAFRPKIHMAGALAAAGLLILPWWIRNYMLFGKFVPLTTATGLSLAFMESGGYFAPPASLSPLAEPARFGEVGKLTAQLILSHPSGYLTRVAMNVANAVIGDDFTLARLIGIPNLAFVATLDFLRAELLILTVLGRDIVARRALAAGIIAIIPAMFLQFGQRHLYFVLPFMFILAADAGDRIIRTARQSRTS